MKTVKLYGHLGEKYGREFFLDVKSPAEAIRLLAANYSDFTSSIVNYEGAGYYIVVGKTPIPIEDIHKPTSQYDAIKLVPMVSGGGGGKGSGLLMMAAGVALIVASGGLAAPAVGTATATGAATGAVAAGGWAGISAATWATIGTNVGIGLVLSGISMLLYTPPTIAASTNSINFDGAVNTTKQGECVPVGYGRCMVGSAVISAGVSTQLFNGV